MDERKPSIHPSQFTVPSAKQGEVQILHCFDRYSTWINVGDGKYIEQTVDGFDVAKAVCSDFTGAMIGIDTDCRPGLFAVEGVLTKEEVQSKHPDLVRQADQNQRNWMQRLVRLADDDWKKTGQHKVISDIQRFACDYLGLDRPWNLQIADEIKVRCPFCTTLISNHAIKCPQCNEIVDQKRYEQMTRKAS